MMQCCDLAVACWLFVAIIQKWPWAMSCVGRTSIFHVFDRKLESMCKYKNMTKSSIYVYNFVIFGFNELKVDSTVN